MSDASRNLILSALDPQRSVVVEACAGSGKTWLLASRIVRLLLAGVPPGEILAITFTRKAAREIEERVVGWLEFLATGSAAQVEGFLEERGESLDAATTARARGLYERVLSAQPGLAVNTFHGWFLQLVDASPLSANLAGATLVEADSRWFDELWQSFAGQLQKSPDSALTQGFVRLLGEAGLDATRRMIRRALDRRSEWMAFAGVDAGAETCVLEVLRDLLGVGENGAALAEFFSGDWALDIQAVLGLLEMSELATDARQAADLRAVLELSDAGERFALLRGVFLTTTLTPRKREANRAAEKRFTPQGAARLAELHAQLAARVIDCQERLVAERILAFNRDACSVFAAFLAHVDEYKSARRQIDFVDAEWNVLKLLRDEATAAFLQARLDARYSQVLLDEFQDTNPLQWQILRAWLDAYTDAARPRVFLVGDPKQSIYRFRRAEPRLFSVAADFLVEQYGAIRCAQDATRRNAPPIIDVVNALFLGVPEFSPFRPQTSFAAGLPGRVELLPLVVRAETEEEPEREALRDPLLEPAVEHDDPRLRLEAEVLAERIAAMVGVVRIEERQPDGSATSRPARYGDFLLLVRTRSSLAVYERALSAAAIPFDAGSRGGLLEALEVRDCIALLEFLVTPVADLCLAHALRSPLFACGDEDLLALAARSEPSWWERLKALAAEGAASPRLARAAHLLAQWLKAADRLPAHDLLDGIFAQGEVFARYRLAVPEAVAASVEANLRALLLLALDLDGGRYPSLPRFIDELRDLRRVEANDAPDEGAIDMHDTGGGRVRILTIHGAKGLEAPIVWLLGANASPRAAEAWDVLVEWAPESPSPAHFSFFGRKEERGAARLPLFEAEEAAARREELNLLYVAITRARQMFVASGVEQGRGKDAAETPYRRLQTALEKLGGGEAYGEPLPSCGEAALATALTESPATPVPLFPIGERRTPPDAGERFGILLHALLERRTGRPAAEGWWTALGFDAQEVERVLPVAEHVLAAAPLRRFFDPACYLRAWNEVELTNGRGDLLRIDRLVEFDDAMWVIDYKSSRAETDRLDSYRAQVRGYCEAVAAAFAGRTVRGGLVFADGSLVEVL